jgi:hypothetical protein
LNQLLIAGGDKATRINFLKNFLCKKTVRWSPRGNINRPSEGPFEISAGDIAENRQAIFDQSCSDSMKAIRRQLTSAIMHTHTHTHITARLSIVNTPFNADRSNTDDPAARQDH